MSKFKVDSDSIVKGAKMVIPALFMAALAFIDSLSESKRDKEFEEMKDRITELENKES